MKTILVDAIHCFVIKGEGIFEPMHQLLERYPQKKILLTGANDEEFIRFGLNKMPYEVFTLKHDPEKSDPAYYRECLSRFNLTPEDVVYFEHASAAVESAQATGINTYHYDSETQDIESLKKFLDSNL